MPPSLEDLTTDQLLHTARQTQASHDLLSSLLGNPETRATVQRAMKKLKPELVIPEIDVADQVASARKADEERIAKLERSIQEREIIDRIAAKRRAVQDKYRLTEADIAGVEKVMLGDEASGQAPIPDYDSAARVYLASKQTATPTSVRAHAPVFEMPETDVWGKGIGNKAALDKIALSEAFKAFDEIGGNSKLNAARGFGSAVGPASST